MAIVYLLHNTVNDKLYVGKTVRTLDVRWKGHVNGANRDANDMMICRAIRKHGAAVFERRIIEECCESIVDEREKFWIAELKTHVSQGGYNLTFGGEGTSGYKFSDESKQRIREAATGRKHTPEARAKMSEAAKKRVCNIPRGYVHSAETRMKISASRKAAGEFKRGYTLSAETRAKIALASKNRVVSEETREKLRAVKRRSGWQHTAETRAAMAAKKAKPVMQYSIDGTLLGTYPSAKEAAAIVGVPATSILRSVHEQRPKHNFLWKNVTAVEVQ
jgi:group I intron endonuclease